MVFITEHLHYIITLLMSEKAMKDYFLTKLVLSPDDSLLKSRYWFLARIIWQGVLSLHILQNLVKLPQKLTGREA